MHNGIIEFRKMEKYLLVIIEVNEAIALDYVDPFDYPVEPLTDIAVIAVQPR